MFRSTTEISDRFNSLNLSQHYVVPRNVFQSRCVLRCLAIATALLIGNVATLVGADEPQYSIFNQDEQSTSGTTSELGIDKPAINTPSIDPSFAAKPIPQPKLQADFNRPDADSSKDLAAPGNAFTSQNPSSAMASLSSEGFGQSSAAAKSAPKLVGAQPVGTYALQQSDGRNMFTKPPVTGLSSGQVSPNMSNNLNSSSAGANSRVSVNDLRSSFGQPQPDQNEPPQVDSEPTGFQVKPQFSGRPNANRLPPIRKPEVSTFEPTSSGFNANSASQSNKANGLAPIPSNRIANQPKPLRQLPGEPKWSQDSQNFEQKNSIAQPSPPMRDPNVAPAAFQQNQFSSLGSQSNSNVTAGQNTTQFQANPNSNAAGANANSIGNMSTNRRGATQNGRMQNRPPGGANRPATQQFSNQRNNVQGRNSTQGFSQPNNGRGLAPVVRTANAANAAIAPNGKAETKVDTNVARRILTAYAPMNRQENEVQGRRVSLLEVLRQPAAGTRQSVVNQYWMTFYDQANSMIANDQVTWLQTINGASNQSEQVMLNAAKQTAENQALSREIQLGKSQLKLQQLIPGLRSSNGQTNNQVNGQSSLPLPSDLPWVGKYATNYKQYQNRMPQRLQGIDEMLPKAFELLSNRAKTVETAKSAANQAKAAYLNGRTQLATVLESARIWHEAERSLVASVVSYNQAIADYALNLRQDINQPERVVAMLIGKKALTAAKQNRSQRPQPDSEQNVASNNVEQANGFSQGNGFGQTNDQSSPTGIAGQGTADSPFTAVSTINGNISDSDGNMNGQSNPGQLNPAQTNSGQTSNRQARSTNAPNNNSSSTSNGSQFQFGPTPDSAAKANFDRSRLTTNQAAPYREAQSTSPSVSSIPKASAQAGANRTAGQFTGQGQVNSALNSGGRANNANGQGFQGSNQRVANQAPSGITGNGTGPTGGGPGAAGGGFAPRGNSPLGQGGATNRNPFTGAPAGAGGIGTGPTGISKPLGGGGTAPVIPNTSNPFRGAGANK